jgi:site-specific recombinase XerD
VTKTRLRVMTDLIQRHCAHLKQRGLSDRTIGARRDILSRIDRDLPMGIDQATVEELSDWLARDGWTRKTRATYYEHVKGYFDWATDENNPHLDWNPAASLARPSVPEGVPKPVTDDEVAEAIRTAGQWKVPIILAAYAGLRCVELATVERRDINRHTITVTGKGDKTRVIPTADPAWEAVEPLTGRLVAGTAHQIAMGARRHFARAGLAGVTMHRFRHWFATTMLANGVDLLTVSKLLGHSSTAVTARYCLISDGQRRTAIATLPVLAPAST